MLKELMMNTAASLEIEISETQADQFMKYKDLIIEWNKKFNLTAITDEKEIIIKHFIDSVTVLKILNLSEKAYSVIDVGSGAGFPGIPLKIMNPSCKVTLLDAVNKKVGFMNMVVNELGLTDTAAIHARAEDAGKSLLYRESYDFCFSRAVANLSVLSEFCLPLVKKGGTFVSLKGPSADTEILAAENALKILGGCIEQNEMIEIPGTDLEHKIIIIKKFRHTPAKYPRKAGIVRQKPLK